MVPVLNGMDDVATRIMVMICYDDGCLWSSQNKIKKTRYNLSMKGIKVELVSPRICKKIYSCSFVFGFA